MIAVLVDGPNSGAVAEVSDGAQTIGPIEGGTYVNTGSTDAQGRTVFRWTPPPPSPETPDPKLIILDPPPLNPFRNFPFVVDEFPAYALLGGTPFANVTPAEEPVDLPLNPNRKELR